MPAAVSIVSLCARTARLGLVQRLNRRLWGKPSGRQQD
jgi:hypothetical protein